MKLIFHFLIAALLFCTAPDTQTKQRSKLKSASLSYESKDLTTSENKIWKAFVTGDKTSIKRHDKQDYRRLNLLHLFTPSGLHFSSLLILLIPLTRRRLKLKRMVEIPILLASLFLPGFYAIKRIALLRLGFMLRNHYFEKLSPYYLFLLVFFIDFIFGTYSKSPLSFNYSFLFLGTLFLFPDNLIKTSGSLAIAQIFAAFLEDNPINLAGILPGQLLTIMFSFLFPFMLIGFFLNIATSFPLATLPIKIFLNLVKSTSSFIDHFDGFMAPGWILLFIAVWKFKKFRIHAVTATLITLSTPILNFPVSAFKKGLALPHISVKDNPERIAEIKKTRRGRKIRYKNGRVCNHTLYESTWSRKCRFK